MATASFVLSTGCATTAREVVAELSPETPGAEIELMVSKGKQAQNGEYPTTVMIESHNTKGPPGKQSPAGSCSGVFISRRLVLTAAHCMCLHSILRSANKALNASDCESRVQVLQYARRVEALKDGGRRVINEFRPVQGSAFLPDKFRVDVNKDGFVTSVHSDVAIIRLDQEMDVMLDHDPADREFKLRDRITVVGFGSTFPGGSKAADSPHSGTNTVTGTRVMDFEPSPPTSSKAIDPEQERSAADFQDPSEAHAELGDSGGPCFREEGKRRWLMGIVVHRVNSLDPVKTRCLDLFKYKPLLKTLIEQASAETN